MASVARKTAPRPAKPVQRHFAKKGPTAAEDVDSSSDDEQGQAIVEKASDEEIETFDQEQDAQSFVSPNKPATQGARTVKVALANVNVKDGRVLVDEQVEAAQSIVAEQGQ